MQLPDLWTGVMAQFNAFMAWDVIVGFITIIAAVFVLMVVMMGIRQLMVK